MIGMEKSLRELNMDMVPFLLLDGGIKRQRNQGGKENHESRV
jgi:hypothetical protein